MLPAAPPKRSLRSHPPLLRQGWRMTVRDWRAGELTMLLLALILAVAALSSVGFLADRLARGLERDARQMIGADLVVRADHPVDPQFIEQARDWGLRTASTTVFPSMVAAIAAPAAPASSPAVADLPTRLAAVKAVSPGYPLRGSVSIAAAPDETGTAANSVPAPGTVWIDPQLLDSLHVKVGGALKVGTRQFTVAALITRELDRGFAFVNFSPRVMLRADDLPSTGLLTFGSRATYRLLVAGSPAAVARYTAWAHAQVDGNRLRGVALESIDDGQPQVRDTLTRARHFLTLVAMLTALLAAVAIAMAAHRYARRHLDGGAVMRCLGASERTLRGLFLVEFVLVGLAGSALGVVLGFAGHYALLEWLGGLIGVSLPQAGVLPAVEGIASGLVLLLGFALPPLAPLTSVPPGRVLRRELEGNTHMMWLGYAVGIACFGALLMVAAGEIKLGVIVAGGFAAGMLGFGLLARIALWALARLARSSKGIGGLNGFGGFGGRAALGWRYALASLERRSGASALQITALGIGLMCLLLLAITRNDLVAGWRASTPPDAPNQFVIDIQPDQTAVFKDFLAQHGESDITLSPMIRGRLIALNGRPIGADDYKDDNTKRLIEREFNLSYTSALPSDNRVVAGDWYGASKRPEISMEEGIAEALKIKVGDMTRFDVAGQQIDAPVTSLRKLDWGSFRVNFFVVMPPAALADFPATFITSFHLPSNQHGVVDALVARFPNLTVIDTGALIAQLQRVLDQVIGAVQFLFLFTLAAGVLVLYAALAGTRDERVREAALLRALGASSRQVRGVQIAEFVVVGGLAGLMAALGAQILGAVLAQRIFSFHLTINPWLPLLGTAAGIVCATAGGWASLRAVLARPALQSLREGV
ncbi:ABC transporter permease [Burkholderia sp. L27(2015)]|uniref:ABC transporter permease n=1 Tax=Burkholderia sp. L27(2015) TaxID=1641858 RepID=UPI00131D23F8|nr:FtsX-like permease family protein [Burkholderia sp. L27(2015)]